MDKQPSSTVQSDSKDIKDQPDVQLCVTNSQEEEPPLSIDSDGGPRAWGVLIGGILATTVASGYTNSFGVYQDVYTRSHAASASNVSWIGATHLFLLFAMGLPAGKLLDKGYFRQTTFAGSLIFVLSLFMLSIAHTNKYYQLWLSQGLGLGIGSGLLFVPAVAVQGHHWKRRRGFAMSVVVLGTSIGGIIFPILLNHLFESSLGFTWGVRVSAFLCLVLLVVANLLLIDNPSLKSQAEQPSVKKIAKDVPFWIFILGDCRDIFPKYACIFSTDLAERQRLPVFYLQLFSILHGVDPVIAFYTLSVLHASGFVGRTVSGMLADRFGPFNIMIPTLLANTALLFALFGIGSAASSMVYAVLYGTIVSLR
ncbi:hypothetical protein ONZ45_g9058 [Pleurotus djamor]|nr:hypothetical protein ONZ45_g9058 [Pleurotus djamor]